VQEHSVSGHQLRTLRRHTLEWSVDYSELTFGKPLGKGSQGEVFRAKWRYVTSSSTHQYLNLPCGSHDTRVYIAVVMLQSRLLIHGRCLLKS
jgi:hypothetical protein